ncbi:MAG: M15 family metallopeptidase [Victivallales bacterium]|nr:M15 family metallopeptidase [Victivallales bacterium]MCF7888605.1 M15 family metallopeptidase [Victivallales bacterium]
MKVILVSLVFICAVFSFGHLCAANTQEDEYGPLPESIRKKITGKSWKEGCPVSMDQLSYLKVKYWGFDNKPHIGELIVNKAIAEDTVKVFKELFEVKYPIQSMKLPSYYVDHPDDPTRKNNTSAFYFRKDTQSPNKNSIHSYGIAIDLNPFYNPAIVAHGKVEPEGAEKYLNRKLKHKGMIHEGDDVFMIMTKHGWAWGQYFKQGVDPMHFEKIVNRQYIIKSLEYYPNKWAIDEAL